MRYGFGSLFLALMLSTAATAFADNIRARFGEGDGMSGVMQLSAHKDVLREVSSARNFGVSTFTEGEFRIGFSPEVRMSDFTKDDGALNVSALLNLRLGSDNRQTRWIDLGSNNGNSFGRADERARWKHIDRHRIGADAMLSAVAVPEPGSQTLLLFGLTGLGMIVYRRKAVRGAI